jgi:hypothetical protein
MFVLLQVPLWYKCTNSSTLLVFSNIRIVSNMVGLLDGKHNMAAIKLKCALNNTSVTLSCCGRTLAHIDEGNHYFPQLSALRRFLKGEKGLAMYRRESSGPLHARTVQAACLSGHNAEHGS